MTFAIPIKVPSAANLREHWRAKASRVKRQRLATYTCLGGAGLQSRLNTDRWHGCTVTLIRVAPRALDSDNLQSALKAIRDEVASMLGRDDGSEWFSWQYSQRKGLPSEYRVDIDISNMHPCTMVEEAGP